MLIHQFLRAIPVCESEWIVGEARRVGKQVGEKASREGERKRMESGRRGKRERVESGGGEKK